MQKKICVILTLLTIFFSQSLSFASEYDEYILKSDYQKAYIGYNKELKKNSSALNNYNMCKVTYYLRDMKTAKMYCSNALNISDADKNADSELRSLILSMTGNIYSGSYRNTDITLEYYKEALQLQEKAENKNNFELAKLYSNIGFSHYNNGDTEIALNYYNKALKLSENKNNEFNVIKAGVYNDLGLIERRNKNYAKSSEYFEKGIAELNEAGEYTNNILAGILYENLARHYKLYNKNNDKLKEYSIKSQEEYGKIPKASEPGITLKEFPYDADLNIKKGSEFLKEDDKKADEYFLKAINVNPQNANIYIKIAREYAKAKYKREASEYIKIAVERAPYTPSIYKQAAEIYKEADMISDENKMFKKYLEVLK